MPIIKLKPGKLSHGKDDPPDTSYEHDDEIERVCVEIAEMANKGNDNDWWEWSETIARDAVRTALLDKDLIEGIAKKWGLIQSGWIKCSERLPKAGSGDVLALAECGQMAVVHRCGYETCPHWHVSNMGYGVDLDNLSPVTHWTELPKPPEGE